MSLFTSTQSPQTPPKRRQRFSARHTPVDEPQAGLSPDPSPKSGLDSGVEDLFDSPEKTRGITDVFASRNKLKLDVVEVEERSDEDQDAVDGFQTPLAEKDFTAPGKLMPEDPFASEHSRILFEAIDELQTWGSGQFLDIPQLIIVGGQSTGKSSLLQSLTEIPFPVGTGCCTRFPTRIVSRRTPPGTSNYFKISVEMADVRAKGSQRASGNAKNYVYAGETLSTEKFVEVMEEISSKYMGIRRGQGADKKNFSADVLKIELSGPKRSYFSILDLPGIFHNSSEVNESDIAGVKTMITGYMKKPENIVICVADALTDLNNHEILKMAKDHVDKQRLVGVFTKCDRLDPVSRDTIVSIATGPVGRQTIPSGWFLVRNRTENDAKSVEVKDAEETLFSAAPWTSIAKNRLGSVALKTYLGSLLSAKIRSSFPDLQAEIHDRLHTSVLERYGLGQPRDSHLARQQYLMNLVRKYEDKAKFALERPGFLETPAMELRREIRRLNEEFDQFMRGRGASWLFEFDGQEAKHLLQRNFKQSVYEMEAETERKAQVKAAINTSKTAFAGCSVIGTSQAMRDMIEQSIEDFKGAQLPGVINPDIYPIVYRQQVQKWPKIIYIHLRRVNTAVKTCYEALLQAVCPPTGGTKELHQRLKDILAEKFEQSYQKLEDLCLSECERETDCTMPLTTDPRFETELYQWRCVRFSTGYTKASKSETNFTFENMERWFKCMHSTMNENMVNEVHDVVRVYYKLSLEAFVRDITNKYIEDFINDKNGPIRGLSMAYIVGLSEKEVEKLASEDEVTLERRRELDEEIEQLQKANAIAEKASEMTADLGNA